MNSNYDDIKISKDLDNAIDMGIENAELKSKKNKRRKKFKVAGSIAAALAIIITLGVTNPAIAKSIPFIRDVFKLITDNRYYSADYSKNAKTIDKEVIDNKINVTLNQVLCDGEYLYVTYEFKGSKPLPKSSPRYLRILSHFNISFLKPDYYFPSGDPNLVEGKYVDDCTFIGVIAYPVGSANQKVPKEFTYECSISQIGDKSASDKVAYKGNWKFKAPIKIDTSLIKSLPSKNYSEEDIDIDSVKITPYNIRIKLAYKNSDYNANNDKDLEHYTNYEVVVKDDKGNEVPNPFGNMSETPITDVIIKAPSKDCKFITMQIIKSNFIQDKKQKGCYNTLDSYPIFYRTIKLK